MLGLAGVFVGLSLLLLCAPAGDVFFCCLFCADVEAEWRSEQLHECLLRRCQRAAAAEPPRPRQLPSGLALPAQRLSSSSHTHTHTLMNSLHVTARFSPTGRAQWSSVDSPVRDLSFSFGGNGGTPRLPPVCWAFSFLS